MTAEERQELITRINEEITATKARILELEELVKPIAPDNAIGRLSRMDAINNRSVNEAALGSAQTKLNKLQQMLSKIDDADFGRCSMCGRPIRMARLIYMPESDRCINCAR
ncbi:MAG: hypothetical protein D6675_04900 [Gemmatimonadetes bacterium]|nr:MAG: hypothetical protein D6675_04900 [Gemmatimonadota bacterium]